MKKQLAATIGIAAAALLTPPAHAVTMTTIFQPIKIVSSVGERKNQPIDNIINQKGLSKKYTSGETDFSEFTRDVAHTIGFGDNFGLLSSPTGRLIFTLSEASDDPPTIQAIAIWNIRFGTMGLGINTFNLFAAMDNIVGNETVLIEGGSVSQDDLTPNIRNDGAHAQIFTFKATRARFVYLDILSNWGDSTRVGAEEIAFEQSASPVPFEFGPIPGIIFIVTVGGMNYFRKKRRWKRQMNGSKLVTSDQ